MVMEYGVSCLPCFCWFFRHACTHTYPCVLGSSSVRNAKKKKGEGGEEDHTHIYGRKREGGVTFKITTHFVFCLKDFFFLNKLALINRDRGPQNQHHQLMISMKER